MKREATAPATKNTRGFPGTGDHYAVVTNWNLLQNKLQEAIEFYNQRGNGENVIREHKYAFDLKHFPCKKMAAHRAYALFALIAHNHLRTIALLDNRERPLYTKRFRFKFIYHPGKIVRHAHKQILKITLRLRKEVEWMKTAWAATRPTALALAG